jgi:hypothetical protein
LKQDGKKQGDVMNNCPFYAKPGVANFEKRVVGVFVVEKLVALFQKVQAVECIWRILDVGVLVFSPGEVHHSAVVGEEERTAKKKKERE